MAHDAAARSTELALEQVRVQLNEASMSEAPIGRDVAMFVHHEYCCGGAMWCETTLGLWPPPPSGRG